jgi:hypothetical protein
MRTRQQVSVSEMAAMVGLSRSRFYALVKEGVFPPPLFEMFKHRAVYVRVHQQLCLQVRRSGRGINGKFVRFRNNSL